MRKAKIKVSTTYYTYELRVYGKLKDACFATSFIPILTYKGRVILYANNRFVVFTTFKFTEKIIGLLKSVHV